MGEWSLACQAVAVGRGTGRGTGGREIPVLSALRAWFGVLFVQVAALRRTRVPLVKRRWHAQDQRSEAGRTGDVPLFREQSYHTPSRQDTARRADLGTYGANDQALRANLADLLPRPSPSIAPTPERAAASVCVRLSPPRSHWPLGPEAK